jgi:membrane-associated phospholipid phosphatase
MALRLHGDSGPIGHFRLRVHEAATRSAIHASDNQLTSQRINNLEFDPTRRHKKERVIKAEAVISTETETVAPATPDLVPGNRFFHVSMAVLSAALLIVAVICLAFFRYSLPLSQLASCASFLPFIGAMGYCWWAKNSRLFQACALATWAAWLSTLLKFPLYIAGRSRAPLQDHLLAHLDRMTGLEVPSILHWIAQVPWARSGLAFIYDLLFPMMVVAAIVPALRYRFTAAKELIVATCLATLVGAPLFALWPAIGPWSVYGYAPSPIQSQTQALFLTLRANSFHAIDINEPGFVCFPSFHVLLAILSATALCSVKPLRIPAILLALLIAVSTLTTGWHYLTDVAGGVVLSALAVLASKWFTRIEARMAGASNDR